MWRSDAKTLNVADLMAGTVKPSKSTSAGGSHTCISPDGKAFAEWKMTRNKRVKIWLHMFD